MRKLVIALAAVAAVGIALNVLMLVVTFAVVIAGGELGRRRNLADARKIGAATAA